MSSIRRSMLSSSHFGSRLTEAPSITSRARSPTPPVIALSRCRLLDGSRWNWLWQPHHAKRVEQPDEPGKDRNQEGHLEGPRSGIRVDADDLVLNVSWLARELLLELGVAQHLCVVLQRLRDLLLLGGAKHGARV